MGDSTAPAAAVPDSTALAFAVAEGLPARYAYTVEETERYSGIPKSWLYKAIKDGRLAAKTRDGNVKGARITVLAMDRYMEAADEVAG